MSAVGLRDALEQAEAIVLGRPADPDVDTFAATLDALDDSALLQFDVSVRGWGSGFGPGEIAALHAAHHRAWTLLALVSADGFDREAAVGEAELRRGTVRLLVLRATDWVDEVRAAALRRLAAVPAPLLLDVLPLVEHLACERVRGDDLGAVLDRRLGEPELRAATASPDPRVRRAAWRRRLGRGAYDAEELRDAALRDTDVMVRAAAAGVIDELDERGRRMLAEQLIGDRVGRLAGRGLAVLVELDGEPAILAALTSPSTTLRRHARGWAAARGIDARAVHLEELERDARHPAALVALAEIADARDAALLFDALDGARSLVRAVVLKALAHLDPAAVKAPALREMLGGAGKPGRAAVAVLARAELDARERAELAAFALDPDRADGARLRALAALQQARWLQLLTLLQARTSATGALRSRLEGELHGWLSRNAATARGPSDVERAAITPLIASLDAPTARLLDFLLRTAHTP